MFEKEVTDLCCSTCNAEESCKEKCECWTFAKKSMEFGYNKANERLTKAKKLLTRFIMGNVYFYRKETDLVEKAKQFLSELEEVAE